MALRHVPRWVSESRVFTAEHGPDDDQRLLRQSGPDGALGKQRSCILRSKDMVYASSYMRERIVDLIYVGLMILVPRTAWYQSSAAGCIWRHTLGHLERERRPVKGQMLVIWHVGVLVQTATQLRTSARSRLAIPDP